jgi:hypothetical protein
VIGSDGENEWRSLEVAARVSIHTSVPRTTNETASGFINNISGNPLKKLFIIKKKDVIVSVKM